MRQLGLLVALIAFLGMSASSDLTAQQSAASTEAEQQSDASAAPDLIFWSHGEIGRKPFQQSVENGTCEEASTCQAKFTTVPPYMRLVITNYNASASIVSVGANKFVYSTLSGAKHGVINTFLHSVPVSGFSFVNEPTLMYFEPGQTPVAQVTDSAGILDIRVTISGYFIRIE